MSWTEPRNIREWAARLLTIRTLVVVLVVYGSLLSELRFDWIERLAGNYLAATNSGRPESGAIWETSRETQAARRTLEQIVTDRQLSRRESQTAESFARLADILPADQGVMLSTDQFRKLYIRLPAELARQLISPYELIRLTAAGDWIRTYCTRSETGLRAYLLDSQNRVLKEVDLDSDLIRREDEAPVWIDGALDAIPRFAGRIYPAGRFFAVLESLPEEVRRGIVSEPETLLALSAPILRVGISDEVLSGFVEIGLEVEASERRRVRILRAREWALWRLRSALEPDTEAPKPEVPQINFDRF